MAGTTSAKKRLLALLQRERGIDDDHEHHLILFRLRLLDDHDNYQLLCEMELEDDELNPQLSVEQLIERRGQWAALTDVPRSKEDLNGDDGAS